MRWLAFALLVMGLSACATSSLTLSPAEMAGIRIDEIRITFKEEATVWWGKAEEDCGIRAKPDTELEGSRTATR
jgi:hypothetical protein